MSQFFLRSLIFSLALLSVFFGNSQPTSSLPHQKIIFKIKETHRAEASNKSINIKGFNQILEEINGSKISKVFPNKKKEKRVENVDLSLIYELEYVASISVNEVIRKIRKLKITEYIEPYYFPKLCYTPNDSLLSGQYYLDIINAQAAWDLYKGDTNIVIGIVDTGWEPSHPDLAGNAKLNYEDPINGIDDDGDGYVDNYKGWDVAMNDNDASWESISHGVNVAGVAAAVTDNAEGIAGVGFNTKFMPIKISNNTGILTHAYQGIVYAADHGCFIINCSWGGYNYSQFNQDIINYATINKGCLVVAAAGNDNSEEIFYPAGYKGVLSVAATNQTDLKATFSNYGHYIDISAPGRNISITGINGTYNINSGTSLSSPIVSGAAALLKGLNPSYTNKQIEALIKSTADDIEGFNPSLIDRLGAGRLNLSSSVSTLDNYFLGLKDYSINDNNNNIFESGDELTIQTTFINYLNSISGVEITLSSTSPYVEIIKGNTTLPALGMMETFSSTTDLFKVKILEGGAFNDEILFKITISNEHIFYNEYFSILINPDYINLKENQVSTTITSKGNIGFVNEDNSIGEGFSYKGKQLLYEAGLMIGDGSERVADVVRGIGGSDKDFSSIINAKVTPPFVSSKDVYGVINDSPLLSPMNIKVDQYAYAYSEEPDDKYIIVVYEIENNSFTTLTNLYVGIFADWDIVDANLNKAKFDKDNKLSYVHSFNNEALYAGIKVLSNTNALAYCIDEDADISINGSGFSTEEKYLALSTSRINAGGNLGNDVAHVVSSGPLNLSPGERTRIAFAIIAGDNLNDLEESAASAQIKYISDNLDFIQKGERGNEFVIYPNPTSGKIRINTKDYLKLVTVTNVVGEIVTQKKTPFIDISQHPNGIYLVEVLTARGRSIQKVILSR